MRWESPRRFGSPVERRQTDGPATFGVVTPTLNAEKYLEATLASIWSQRGDSVDVDHVLVDGESTDHTVEIASRYPTRVVVAKDGGMYEAVNRGLSMVRGEIVGYMNADDEVAPGAFDLLARTFRRRPEVQWVCGTVEYTNGKGEVVSKMTPVRFGLRSYVGIGWSCVPQQTVWMRRSFYDRIGPFDTTFKNCADYDWYARAFKLSPPLFMRETLGRFRQHGENLSWDLGPMIRESRMVQQRHGGLGIVSYVMGKSLSLRLNARNPQWFYAKKSGKLKFSD
jgi:glycosyltransferase involved in cell wall biosynthesis